jgi:hypothetical protein
MSLVLAIEPDRAQADALRAILDGRLGAPLTVVASKDDALAAIDREIPDLVLVTQLLSPREEDELVAFLRTLENASHLQLLTIPRLGRAEMVPQAKKSSLFGFGKKKGPVQAPEGCDPAEFAEQVASYLLRAREVRSRPRPIVRPPVPVKIAPEPAAYEPSPQPVWQPPVQTSMWEPPSQAAHEPPPLPSVYEEQTSQAPAYHSWLAPAEPPAPSEPLIDLVGLQEPLSLPPVTDAVEGDVDSIIERLGFEPLTTPVAENDLQKMELDLGLTSVAPAVEEYAIQIPEPLMALVPAEDEVIVDIDAVLDGAPPVEPVPLIDLAPFRAEAEATLAAEVARVEEAARRREAELAEGAKRREAELAEATERREAQLAETVKRREAELAEEVRRREAELAETAERMRAEAEAKAREAREAISAELARVKAEAAQQREVELAQWQAEAEALRQSTVGRAREDAETKAREALDAELARSRTEAEQLRREEIARLQAEADERLDELARQARQVAEAEAARAFAEELARVRADSESSASRALESEVSRVRADADARLQAELERIRHDAEAARRAEQAAAHEEAERIRLAAAREAREIAEAAANRTLQAEIQRVRAEADARFAVQTEAQVTAEKMREAAAREARTIAEAAALEAKTMAEAATTRTLEVEVRRVRAEADARLSAELAQLRADAERRRAIELDEMRRQVEEMREAAAQQARTAAAEAIAVEVARATALRGPASVTKPVVVVRAPAAPKVAVSQLPAEEPDALEEATEAEQPASSYYDLWRSEGSPAVSPADAMRAMLNAPSRFRRKRWVLPAAASILLVVSGSVSVDTTGWRETAKKAKQAIDSAMPASNEKAEAEAAIIAASTGNLLVETTPKGAKVSVDGKHRGQTPLTVTELTPGKHKVVLESNDGVVIRRDVTIRAGERAVASELMVSGWLTVHSRVPVEVHVGGRRVGASGDPQITLSPGRHKVTFVNRKLNIRQTRTIEIRAGSIASHTFSVPSGSVKVDAPAVSQAEQSDQPFDGLKVLSQSAANPGKPVRPPQ